MTGASLIPLIRCAVNLRVNLPVNHIEDNIVGTDCVPASFFAGVLAWNLTMMQEMKGCFFADMSYPVELIL